MRKRKASGRTPPNNHRARAVSAVSTQGGRGETRVSHRNALLCPSSRNLRWHVVHIQLGKHEPKQLLAFLSTCNGPRRRCPENAAARLRLSLAGNCGCCRGSRHPRESQNALLLWCQATEPKSSVAQNFLGLNLLRRGVAEAAVVAKTWKLQGTLISCPTRAHPCTGTTAAAAFEHPSLGISTY